MAYTPPCIVIVAIIVAIGGALPTRAEANVRRVSVGIEPSTAVDAQAMARALHYVTRIYSDAGVEITWKGARPTDDKPLLELTLVMASEQLAKHKDRRQVVMGVAHPGDNACGRIAFVLYDRVNALARRYGQEFSVALGHVIAHELGHLLLPSPAHSRTGVMKAEWSKFDLLDASRGMVLFTAAQAAHMRARIADEPMTQSLSGMIRDSSGAPIANAHVTATDIEHEQTWEAIPEVSGQFRFVALPLGPYRLTFGAAGFGRLTEAITISSGHRLDIPITLTHVSIPDKLR